MFKQLWKKWTVDKPAAFGDLLWEIFVVQLAAWLDRLTLRRIIALIPVVVLILAYAHRIPIPPELMLVGDVLAYIDIFSVILLLSILGRVTALWLFAKQAADPCRQTGEQSPGWRATFRFPAPARTPCEKSKTVGRANQAR
jgi:hypothetical protein